MSYLFFFFFTRETIRIFNFNEDKSAERAALNEEVSYLRVETAPTKNSVYGVILLATILFTDCLCLVIILVIF